MQFYPQERRSQGHASTPRRRPRVKVATASRIAVDADEAGALFGLDPGDFDSLDRDELVPAAFMIGGEAKRWRVADLEDWAMFGFPDRMEFDQMAAAQSAGGG